MSVPSISSSSLLQQNALTDKQQTPLAFKATGQQPDIFFSGASTPKRACTPKDGPIEPTTSKTSTAPPTTTTEPPTTTTTEPPTTTTTEPGNPGTPEELANTGLALDTQQPGNVNLFSSVYVNGANGFYPQGTAMNPDSGPVLSESEMRDELSTHLNQQFGNNQALVDDALALYDDPQVQSLIPDPMPRAAFAALKGTILEPAIDHFLSDNRFLFVTYGQLPVASKIAGSSGGDNNRVIVINDRYQSEDFRYLIGIMGHEILHDDFSTSNAEEAILNSLSAMTYIKTLSQSPELAYSGTELSRQMNDLAMIFLNSREDDSPNSEIVSPSGTGIAPGSALDAPDAWTFFNGDSSSTPGSQPLSNILADLGLATSTDYSQSTAETFENLNDDWLSDQQRLQVSVLLQLVSVEDIAQEAGVSEQDVIDTLELQPYLDVINAHS